MSEELGQKPTEEGPYTPCEAFLNMVKMSHPMGSRYTCDPVVMNTDRDTIILVTNAKLAAMTLLKDGWDLCSNGEYHEGFFFALRRGEDNYVLTNHRHAFDSYVKAAEICKALNLLDKEDRIKVHKACLESSGGSIGLIDWDRSSLIWQTYPHVRNRGLKNPCAEITFPPALFDDF